MVFKKNLAIFFRGAHAVSLRFEEAKLPRLVELLSQD